MTQHALHGWIEQQNVRKAIAPTLSGAMEEWARLSQHVDGRPFLHQPNPGVNLGMPDSGCADGLLDSNCAGLDLGWALACRWPQLGRRQFRMIKFKKTDKPSPKFWNQRAKTEVPFLSPENGLQIGAAWTNSKRRLPRFRAPK